MEQSGCSLSRRPLGCLLYVWKADSVKLKEVCAGMGRGRYVGGEGKGDGERGGGRQTGVFMYKLI